MPYSENPSDYPSGTIIHHHPDWKYHAAPGVSSSAIKTFVNQSPRHYQQRYVLQQADRKETDAMLLGTLVHCLVLEGDQFESRYEQELNADDVPDAMRTVPELKKYLEQNNLPTTGVKQELIQRIIGHNPAAQIWDTLVNRQRQSRKRIIKTEIWDRARRMRDGVMDNGGAADLLKVGEPELSVWGTHEPTGQLIKCRADWYRPDGICADLKTCACSSPEQFARDCAGLAMTCRRRITRLRSTVPESPAACLHLLPWKVKPLTCVRFMSWTAGAGNWLNGVMAKP